MSPVATATFTFDLWESEPVLEAEGSQLARTSMAKTFAGDLVGTSRGQLVMAGADSGTRAYCGYERLDVELQGRQGSFVLRHDAFGDASGGTMQLSVMGGSGTGALAGITGTADITRHEDGSHTFTLDYDLP